MESYSRYVGDRGVEEAMKVLLGNGFDASNPAYWVPEQVARLEEYPPYDLTPHLQDQPSVEYTAGQTDTVNGYIDITMRHLAATIATCCLTSSQNETTRRAFIDPILVLVCTLAASLRSLKPGLLQLCMEYGVDQANNSGKIDYVLKYLMALLLSLVVAKGDGGLSYHRGQTLAELAAVKQSNVVEGRKRNWDETQSPAIAVLTNSSDWEFYVYRPLAEPPVVYWEIATPTEMLWKDLAKLRQRFMPVIEQLLAIVLAELDRVQERQVSKKKRTGP